MPAAPRSPRKLSPDLIVAEALAMAEGEGVGAVTLRPLAARLGVSATALYRHVDSRGALLGLMLERRLADDYRDVPADRSWDDALRWYADNMWRVYGAVPGLAAETLAGRVTVARTQESAARMIGVLADGGFGDDAPAVAFCFVHWGLSFLAALEHRPAEGEGYAEVPGHAAPDPRAVYADGVELHIAGLQARLAARG
ncbi:TetR family transcriptional regulator [Patulibacter sp. SYSU D01012]|uniref:TetR/AcrR family transcriptional regulator n=1 Tax=Patulibacter sp. SYSU D01012 TaxID=2817381 RepID=UPI001B3132D4|nr:TetR family transcriptional regulator [Patulibacter sp. SYSU D01012]